MALLLYLLRDPVYASVTLPATGKVRSLVLLFIRCGAAETHGGVLYRVIQVCDVLDYVPVAGRAIRFASTAVMNYYHQFHFYTSAS